MAAWGGTRAGAGRKPKAISAARRSFAEDMLPAELENALWDRMLHSNDDRVVLDALKFLTDHKYGRAVQRAESMGPEGGPIRIVCDL
jgi:hypothetical protein